MEQKQFETISQKKFCIKQMIKSFNIAQWMAFIGLFIFSISYAFTINDFLNAISKDASTVWFGIMDRFTNQSNWLLFIYCFLFLCFKNHSFLKHNGLLISVMVYIFFTFIGYNVVLVGIGGGYGYTGNSLEITSNVWLHILCPLYFIGFGLVKMYCYKNQEPKSFIKVLLYGMIYPTIYMIYLITIPFTYTSYTELNLATGIIERATYSVYGTATNVKDYPIAWAYILVMYLGFFPGSYAIFYYSWKGFNKLNAKKQ